MSHSTFTKGRAGSRGDPLMPLLFALGQHSALVAAEERLRDGERMAFLDDVDVVCAPDQVGRVFSTVEWNRSCRTVPTSSCTTARHKFGIVEEWCPEE